MIFLIPLGNSFNNRGQIEGDEFYSRRILGQEDQEDQEDQGDQGDQGVFIVYSIFSGRSIEGFESFT